MSSQTALVAFTLLVVWLLWRDRDRQEVSWALWIPTIWALILGSRPVSNWFGMSLEVQNADDYLEGSPVDRMLLMVLIGAAMVVLWRRRFDWRGMAAQNRWLIAYFLYFGVSVVWSDYPFTAFKRWVKDVGNLLMALVILAEPDPFLAFKTVLRRYAVVLVPMSVLLIKYYTELGRYYDNIAGEPFCRGVTQFKNQLGMTVALSVIYLAWAFADRPQGRPLRTYGWAEVFPGALILLMSIWLLKVARSATAQACAMLGVCAFLLLLLPAVKKRLGRVLRYCAFGALIFFVLSSVFDIQSVLLNLLGRDATLTGRTKIWKLVLAESSNPLIGSGFYSFWAGERMTRIWQQYDAIVQAHNGYLETYLNGGVIGLFFLIMAIVAAGRSISRALPLDPQGNGIRIVLWFITIIYNWTEASFSKLSPLWLCFLTVVVLHGRRTKPALAGTTSTTAVAGFPPAEERTPA